MKQANMHEAKSKLSQLAELAAGGETVIIAKSGKPYVQLTAIPPKQRTPGGFEQQVSIGDDFFAADHEIITLFEGDE